MLPVSNSSSHQGSAQTSPRRAPAMNASNSSEALLSSSPTDATAVQPVFSYNTTAPDDSQLPAQLSSLADTGRPPALLTDPHPLTSPPHAERIALTYSQQVPASAHPNLEPSSWNASAAHSDKASASSPKRPGSLFRRPTLGGWSQTGPSPRLPDAPLSAPVQSPTITSPSAFKGWSGLRAAMRAKNKFIHRRHHHHHAAEDASVHRVPGAAPGIDIESESIDKYFSERLVGQVNGMVVDFNADTYQIRQGLANADLCDWISKPRPEYSAVRWIHVEGMAWDVIKTVSQIHGLHPLSIEDALHLPQRVKVDNFSNHLFISLLVCRLASSDVAEMDVAARHRLLKQRMHPMAESGECALLDIEADNCSMFLLDDGTLITFTHFASGFLIEPILSRLTNATTMLRSLSDASFLLNALIDSIVDHYLPITEAYSEQFEGIEAVVFEKPNIHIIRYLHATHADLIELKQKLLPVQTLIRNLRTMTHRVTSSPTRPVPGSLQRPASVIGASSTTAVLPDGGASSSAAGSKDVMSGTNAPMIARERLSPVCKTYLGDVQDHIDTCIDHVSTLQGWAQNLTDLAFNCISYTTNENMKVLTIASVVFLPITFLAGVYGTNFQYLPELAWPVGYPLFWTACIMLVAITLVYLKRRGFY